MKEITKNLRTHIVFVKSLDWKTYEEIQITKEQYNMISEDIKALKYNDFYTISDSDDWHVLFEWQRWDIVRFKEKVFKKNTWYVVICDYWNRHSLINWKFDCDCEDKYKFTSIWLQDFAYKKYWKMYPQDITEDMKREYYKELKSQWKI